ncbi:MAG: hypothetical protein JWN52_3038 [Actinomycetia bacterium]|nr:hypothetical protein [Actinomycetes bacterium]
MTRSTNRYAAPAAALVLAALLSGCGDGGATANPPAAPSLDATSPAAAAPARNRVGTTYDVVQGVKITLTSFRTLPKIAVDPATYNQPASWRAIEVIFRVSNDTAGVVKLDRSDFNVTAGPKHQEALGAEGGPGSAPGTQLFNETPLLARHTGLVVKTIIAASALDILFKVTPVIDPAPPQPIAPVVWAGDATPVPPT